MTDLSRKLQGFHNITYNFQGPSTKLCYVAEIYSTQLATFYQLAHSILKIGSALAERLGQEEVGGCTALAESAWRLLLPVEKPWVGHLSGFLAQPSIGNAPFTL